jgi:hypothetical protein
VIIHKRREKEKRIKEQNVSLTSFGVFGNETPLNTSGQPRDLRPSCHKIREKVPGNLGSYPFLKIHVDIRFLSGSGHSKIPIRKTKLIFTEKLNSYLQKN